MTDEKNTKFVLACFNYENHYHKHPYSLSFNISSAEDWKENLDIVIEPNEESPSINALHENNKEKLEKFKKWRNQPPSKNVDDWIEFMTLLVDNQCNANEDFISQSNDDEHFKLFDYENNFIKEIKE